MQRGVQVPVAVNKGDGSRQAAPVVDDELQVCHRFVALVDKGTMLRALCLVPVVHLVHHVGNLRQVDVQPRCVLHSTRPLLSSS